MRMLINLLITLCVMVHASNGTNTSVMDGPLNITDSRNASNITSVLQSFETEKIKYDSVKKHFKVSIERGPMQKTTLRAAQIMEGVEPKKVNQTVWSKVTSWFEKENEDFTNEVRIFINSYQHKGVNSNYMKTAKLSELRRHPVVKGNMKINIANRLNTMYYGPIFIGYPSQEMQVIYDTGSDWLVMESKICRTCLKNSYDHLKSSTWVNASSGLKEHIYGSARLYGYNVRDQVSLDPQGTTKVHSFLFFQIYKQTGLNEFIDGILGMSRKQDSNTAEYRTGPLYIDYLYISGMITDRVFCFYITDEKAQSFVDIGMIDINAMKGGSWDSAGLVWIPMPTYTEILFWFGRSTAIRYGEQALNGKVESYTFDQYIPAIFDTGTSMVLVPTQIQADFFGRVLGGHRYVEIGGMYQISCKNKDQFQSIYINIEGYWLQIHPEDYIIEVKNGDALGCVLGFQASQAPYWLLGDVFFRGYYSIHDMTNNQIGFALSKDSKKKKIHLAINPQRTYSDAVKDQSWLFAAAMWWQMFTGWIDIPIALLLCFGCACCCTSCLFASKVSDLYEKVANTNGQNGTKVQSARPRVMQGLSLQTEQRRIRKGSREARPKKKAIDNETIELTKQNGIKKNRNQNKTQRKRQKLNSAPKYSQAYQSSSEDEMEDSKIMKAKGSQPWNSDDEANSFSSDDEEGQNFFVTKRGALKSEKIGKTNQLV